MVRVLVYTGGLNRLMSYLLENELARIRLWSSCIIFPYRLSFYYRGNHNVLAASIDDEFSEYG